MRVKQQHILAVVLLFMISSLTMVAQGDTLTNKNNYTHTLSEPKKELPKYKVYSPSGQFIGEHHQTADNLELINFIKKNIQLNLKKNSKK